MSFDFDQELDCSGLSCPMPILKTKKMLDTMASGQVLRMIATDAGSVRDDSPAPSGEGFDCRVEDRLRQDIGICHTRGRRY